MNNFSVLAMAKEPMPGKVKTRLTPPLPYNLGAYLYEAMLSDTIDILISLKGAEKYVFYEPQNSLYFEKFKGSGISIHTQSGNDLGEKMGKAAKYVGDKTALPVVIIGSDIPLLTSSIIKRSKELLSKTDIVIGPCDDGGYYLIAMKKFTDIPFRNIPWSSKEALPTTISNIEEGGLTYSLTEKLFDIDTAWDIEKYVDYMRANPEEEIDRRRFSRAAIKLNPYLRRLLRPGL